MISAVKATSDGDWVVRRWYATPNDERVIRKLNIGKEHNIINIIFVGYNKKVLLPLSKKTCNYGLCAGKVVYS
jgi:hypothetical protein